VASAMDSPSCGMMMGMEGMLLTHERNSFREAAAMLRVVGR
jgi:hypothetical protein